MIIKIKIKDKIVQLSKKKYKNSNVINNKTWKLNNEFSYY